MMYWPDHMGMWGFGLMGLSTLLFWGLLITGIVLLVRYLKSGGPASDRGGPERILAERYARGDIDEQEYRQRLQVLRGSGSTP